MQYVALSEVLAPRKPIRSACTSYPTPICDLIIYPGHSMSLMSVLKIHEANKINNTTDSKVTYRQLDSVQKHNDIVTVAILAIIKFCVSIVSLILSLGISSLCIILHMDFQSVKMTYLLLHKKNSYHQL